MHEDDFKAWHDKYRAQVRINAQQSIDWPLEEMQAFHQLCHLHRICKAIRHAIVNAPDEDFVETFFEYFGDIRLAEMSNKGLAASAIKTENLH